MTTPIKLLVGLGNPGPEYQATRHNVGFWFVDQLTQLHSMKLSHETKFHGLMGRVAFDGFEVRLLEPSTFVNRSGLAVVTVANYFGIVPEEILVVHDELDLTCGLVRLKFDGGHAGHNGLRDISSALSSTNFWRLRIGIDRPSKPGQMANYVLDHPSISQAEAIGVATDRAMQVLPEIIAGNGHKIMNQLNRL